MSAFIELVADLVGMFIPDKDEKQNRIGAIAFLLVSGVILAAILFFFADYFGFGGS